MEAVFNVVNYVLETVFNENEYLARVRNIYTHTHTWIITHSNIIIGYYTIYNITIMNS